MDKNYMRLPDYLKQPIATIDNKENKNVRKILSKYNLNTVCDNARCPNKTKCFSSGTATFLIMGKNCSRNCRFCNISSDKPLPLNSDEPNNVARAVLELGLQYVVITSTTRDDLEDGGAGHYFNTIFEIRKLIPEVKIEILTPDFKGDIKALDVIIKSLPDVFNHNVETVPSLYKIARPQANYIQSLNVLKYVKENSQIITKTGIMTGLGETKDEIIETMKDIKNAGVDILTIGQYIRPSKEHLPVIKYYKEDEFASLRDIALEIGIKACVSLPLARSSYKAFETYKEIKNKRANASY